MNLVTKTLTDFGLSLNEARVYSQAVKHEETNPYALARTTGIPRTTIYEIIASLSLKGLVELTRSDGLTKQQTKIKAKNPSVLREIIRQKRQELTKLDAKVVHILPVLKADYQQHESDADFRFFPGLDGAKQVFSNSKLDNVDEQEYLFNYKIPDDAFGRDYINDLIDKSYLIEKHYVPKEIIPLNDWTKHCVTYHFARNSNYIKVTETRFIDQATFVLNTRLAIKGDRIWIVSVEGNECYGIIIQSRSFSTSLWGIFQVFWQMAIPVTADLVKSWGQDKY